MILLPDEQKLLFNCVVDDLLKERGSAIYLTDALAYAERAVVQALLAGQKTVTLDLDRIVPMDRAQPEVKALFKEHSQNVFWDKCLDVIDDLFPDIKE